MGRKLLISILFIMTLAIPRYAYAQRSTDALSAAAWSPDGSKFAVAGTINVFSGVIIYDSEGQELTRIKLENKPDGLAWDPLGARLAVRLVTNHVDENPILIYGLSTENEPVGLQYDGRFGSEGTDLLWNSSGDLLVSYVGGNAIIWDTNTGEHINTISIGGLNPIEDLAWHPLTNELYILDFSNNILVYDPVSGRQTRAPFMFDLPEKIPGGPLHFVAAMALNADGSRLAVAYNDDKQTMAVIATDTGESLIRFNPPNPDRNIHVLRWTPDGRQIATFGQPSDAISLWNLETGELAHSYSHFGIPFPRTFAISPDSEQMVVVGLNQHVPGAPRPQGDINGVVTLVPRTAVLIDIAP